MMNKLLLGAFLLSTQGCLSPQEISVNSYSDIVALHELLASQPRLFPKGKMEKSLFLEKSKETKVMLFDSIVLKKDLKVIFDLTFPSLVQSSNYEKKTTGNHSEYRRKESESVGPRAIVIHRNNSGAIIKVEVNFEENNFLYRYSQDVQLIFNGEKLINYYIKGYQIMIGMDSSFYRVDSKIIQD